VLDTSTTALTITEEQCL